MSNNRNTPLFSERYSEKEVRRRIKDYIIGGGVWPISDTGVHNIARLFRIPAEHVQQLIQQESQKLAEGLPYE